MKRLFKTGITILISAGMLTMSLPAFVLADETVNTAEFDPNMLLSEDELPEDAEIIEAPDDGEIYVYIYDEDGKLVPVEPVFEDEDPESRENDDPSEYFEDTLGDEPEQDDEPLESYGPLTPEGNLTLIDDYGSPTGAGKQFITVQTKSGAYYYLIIDRDDNGNEKVHFLNQVDDADILAHMEDEQVAAYQERQAELAAKKEALAAEEAAKSEHTPITEQPGEPAKEGGEAIKKQPLKLDNSSLLIVGAVVIFGIIALIYIKVIKKKKPASNRNYDQDPDEWDDEGPAEVADVPDKQEDSNDE